MTKHFESDMGQEYAKSILNDNKKLNGNDIASRVSYIISNINTVDFDEAINWGDLRIVSVDKTICMYPPDCFGDEEIVVEISEADSSAWKFREYIQKEFKRLYGMDITVRTEW